MKKTTDYTTPGNHNHTIPSREEFHRYCINSISNADYCTDYPDSSGRIIDNIARSINWTIATSKQKYFGGWKVKQ